MNPLVYTEMEGRDSRKKLTPKEWAFWGVLLGVAVHLRFTYL
jgi:hypothetical protein